MILLMNKNISFLIVKLLENTWKLTKKFKEDGISAIMVGKKNFLKANQIYQESKKSWEV